MTATLEKSHVTGSDIVYDCSICEDDGIHKEGMFFCQKCSKYFCAGCELTHRKFFKDHSVTANGESGKRPVLKTVDGALMFCEEHTTEKLTMVREDDEKLLCQVCHLRNHKQCSRVVLLTDKVKSTIQPMDVAQMKTCIESLMELLQDVIKIGEQNTTSLQTSYEKVLEKIVDVGRRFNDNLDRLQHNTERKLKELHSTSKNTLENSRKQCDAFIASREDVPHVVDSNKVISIKAQSQYKVRTPIDKRACNITGICESSNGEFVMADFSNGCVKLLDQGYNLKDQIKISTSPGSMCKISSNEMAVIASDSHSVDVIYFIRVDNVRIVKLKKLKLSHECNGIAFHHGNLFVTSSTAVYQYTMDGRQVKTLYENQSAGYNGVGVSPDGKRIYVTDINTGKLLTLTSDGAVTASLQDPAFCISNITPNLHVAATGQVFVLGEKSIRQVDTDGKKILNTINLRRSTPKSVYFNERTSKLIVGFSNDEFVIEFKTNAS
ncbi:uncharacterized protein LOC127840082 [Dreissena polymorpha]|uniref:B box-type domain-containing protein n=1 Tax=Dreissena polymorpha TaxID=45954 RepID=A0A9D4IZK4_DREPO|nr:uncharacterized protein LOC127840082 [Dreissena polymorpha]KAH3792785.1 hypothetical protein DPMN_146284 [Dreissena polymorpha]